MKKKKYKVSVTWWVGWVVTYPVRLVIQWALDIILTAIPSAYYGIYIHSTDEPDQSKWRLP